MVTLRRLTLLVPAALGLGLLACRTEPLNPVTVGAQRPLVSPFEFERRLQRVEALVRDDRDDEALAEIAASLDEWPPEPLRRRFQRAAYEIRRSRFYREHPIHLALELDRGRYSFGEPIRVRLRVTNLGDERLTLPATYWSWGQAVTFQSPERSVLLVHVTSRDSDGLGSSWSGNRVMDVVLTKDLVIGPGGSDFVEATVEPDEPGRSLFRLVQVSAIYRPIVILSEGGDRRYDPLSFPVASARVFHREHAIWADGGRPMLETCVAGEASGRSEALFLAAVGLGEDELREGIDLLARSAPSLDPLRQRRAVAALSVLTGRSFANDPIRFLGWWEAQGKTLSQIELLQRAGLRDDEEEPGELSIES